MKPKKETCEYCDEPVSLCECCPDCHGHEEDECDCK